jgi:hypothetical protein
VLLAQPGKSKACLFRSVLLAQPGKSKACLFRSVLLAQLTYGSINASRNLNRNNHHEICAGFVRFGGFLTLVSKRWSFAVDFGVFGPARNEALRRCRSRWIIYFGRISLRYLKGLTQLEILSNITGYTSVVNQEINDMPLTFNKHKDIRFQQGKLEGKREGRLEGKLEGFDEKAVRVAQESLKNGASVEFTAKITELPLKRVLEIKSQLGTTAD